MCASNDMLLRAEQVLQGSLKLGIAPFIEHVKIVSAEPGKVDFKFEVCTQQVLNPRGYLHGGVLSLLVDILTMISARTLFFGRGVSINLNVNFVKGIKHGETVYAKAVAVRAGKKLFFGEVHFRDADGNLKAYGGQTIYVTQEENSSQVNSATQLNKQSKL